MKQIEIKNNFFKIGDFIYKYRILICFIIFILFVFLKIHGSSIGMYNNYIQPESNKSFFAKPIIGVSQLFRSDEWAVHTPMALSQKYENYKMENSIWRASPTNMATTYNQPIKAFFSIVKPFYWGYFILDEERGLSWFWCGRTIFLFLITFEFFQIITRRNKLLSLAGSVLTVFSPGIQWWFAINDLVEQIFWGELGIISIYYFMQTNKYKLKLIFSILLGLCIAGFVLCFYPAWQVPFGYIFAAIGIWIICNNWNIQDRKEIDIIFPIISIVIALIIILSLIIPSLEAINITKNTIYPGQRFNLGGNFANILFYYLLPYKLFNFINICELSHFIGLFPLPFIISIFHLIKTKFNDKLILILICVQSFLILYITIGFPYILAKITGMYLSSGRAVMASSFIDIILLGRLFSIKENINIKYKWLISSLYTIIIGIYLFSIKQIQIENIPQESNISMINIYIIGILLFLFIFSYLIIYAVENHRKIKNYIITIAIVGSIACYSLVNPVMIGLDTIYKIPAGRIIQLIQKEFPGRWLVADFYPITNFPTIFGAPTINSTNIYPNFKLWKKLDPNGNYMNVYNNYKHIGIILNLENKTEFFNSPLDFFNINLSINDLPKLGVDYIMSTKFRVDYIKSPKGIELINIYRNNNVNIYKVKYYGEAKEEYTKSIQDF